MRRSVASAAASHSSAILRRLLAGQCPGVEQVQIGLRGGDVFGVGQTRHRVFGGEARDVVGGLHRLLNGSTGKIGGAGVATPLAHIHRDAQRLVAVALDVFQFSLAHRNAQATALGGLGPRVGGAELFGVCQCRIDQPLEKRTGVGKAGFGRWNAWGGGLHIGGYDTWRCTCERLPHPITLYVPQTQKRLLRPWRVCCRRQRTRSGAQTRAQRHRRIVQNRTQGPEHRAATPGHSLAGPAHRT